MDLLLIALDQVPFILAVCEGPELTVLSLSAVTRDVIPGRDYLGRPIGDVLQDLVGQQIVDAYHEVYRTGVPINGQEWRIHLDTPDGSVHEMFANFTITPWQQDGERRGVIGVGFDVTAAVRQRHTEKEQVDALRRRYEQSRDVVTALQRALLPGGLPVLPGAQVAASYLLADADTAAGGDWYDAVGRHDGRLALTVGDVVGHGVAASGVMGQLRAVLQDRLDDGSGLLEALSAADRFAARVPAAHATTVCLVVLDPATGDLTYCTAGHPPPLVVGTDGGTRFLARTGGAPLGTGGAFPLANDHLAPGDVLVLYSDGILERPGRTHETGAAELARVAADSVAGRALREPGITPAERVCTHTVELLVRATGHTDDITLLAVQRVPILPPLMMDLPARPEVLSEARRRLGGWLLAAGAPDEDLFVLQHALGELMTNAIEHAFDPTRSPSPSVSSTASPSPSPAPSSSSVSGPGPAVPSIAEPSTTIPSNAEPSNAEPSTTVPSAWSSAAGPGSVPGEPMISVRAALTADGAVEATVVDHGRWRAAERQPTRGRGLALTAQLVESLRVEPGPQGTVASVRHPLVREARLLDLADSRDPLPHHSADEPPFRIVELSGDDETRVRLAGPLDATTATLARQELLRRSRGGTMPMTADLTALTLLSSAGVSALHQVAEQHLEQKAALTLHAAEGSPAQVVLNLVALPHLTTAPD